MNKQNTMYTILFVALFAAVVGVAAAAISQEASGSGKDFGQCNKKFNKEHKGGGKEKSDARKAACGSLKPKGNETD